MKTLDEIKQLIVAGETVQADAALKELLVKEPDNLQAKMLYGTCRQLLGDEETFKRIHDELAPSFERPVDDPPTAETMSCPEGLSLWKKYHALWMTLIVGGFVLAGVGAIVYYGKSIVNQGNAATVAVSGYRGPQYYKKIKIDDRQRRGSIVDEFADCKHESARETSSNSR